MDREYGRITFLGGRQARRVREFSLDRIEALGVLHHELTHLVGLRTDPIFRELGLHRVREVLPDGHDGRDLGRVAHDREGVGVRDAIELHGALHLFGRLSLPRPRRFRGDEGVRPPANEDAHRVHVGGIGGAQERRGALHVDEAAVAVPATRVLHVPGVHRHPRIRIGSGFQECLENVEVPRVLAGPLLRLRITGTGLPLRVHGGEQRRRTVDGGVDVGIGAVLEEHERRVELAIDRRNQERRGAVAATHLVHISAMGEKGLDALEVSLTGRVEQRRESALRRDAHLPLEAAGAARALLLFRRSALGVDLTAREYRCVDLRRGRLPFTIVREGVDHLGSTLIRPRVETPDLGQDHRLGGDVRVGPAFDERRDDVHAIPGSRKDQRSLLPLRLERIGIGASLHEHPDDVLISRNGREVEWRGTAGIRHGADVRTRLYQNGNELEVPVPTRDVEGSVFTDPRRRFGLGTRIQQGPGNLGVAAFGRPVQRAHPVSMSRVYVGPVTQQGAQLLDVTSHGRVGDRRFSRCCRHHDRQGQGTENTHLVRTSHSRVSL